MARIQIAVMRTRCSRFCGRPVGNAIVAWASSARKTDEKSTPIVNSSGRPEVASEPANQANAVATMSGPTRLPGRRCRAIVPVSR